jgi:uncharacterized protein YcfJ
MKKAILPIIALVMLSACSATTGMSDKGVRQFSTVAGCVGGGYLGSHIGSGSGKTLATVVGTVIGCGAGDELGRQINESQKDQ